MYNEFFGFEENPFKITPDPDFFYMTKTHEKALSLIEYGIQDRKGFILLTGEAGTGKTTICRILLNKFHNIKTSFITNSLLGPDEILYSIVKDFGIETEEGTNKGVLYNLLSNFLVKTYVNGQNVLIIVDESQNLSFESFEMIRMISNIEFENDKIVQILLVGQQELEKKLLSSELRQLNQRISLRAKLQSIDLEESENYIHFRTHKAMSYKRYIFKKSAIKEIYRLSKGNLRCINQIADKSLLLAAADNKKMVTESIVRRAFREYSGGSASGLRIHIISIIIITVIAFGLVVYFSYPDLIK